MVVAQKFCRRTFFSGRCGVLFVRSVGPVVTGCDGRRVHVSVASQPAGEGGGHMVETQRNWPNFYFYPPFLVGVERNIVQYVRSGCT